VTHPAPLPVLIAGAGLMGRWHVHAAERAGARVVAIVDPDIARARALAGRRRGCEPAAEMAGVLGRASVVHVCTPSDTHASIVGDAIDAGRHVLCEKPLAPAAAAVEMLLDRAAARQVLLCPVHQFLFQDGVQAALARLDDIGPLQQIDITIRSAGAAGLDEAGRDRVAHEILPHPMSLIARVAAVDVSRLDWTARRPAPGELRLLAEAGGAGLSVTISMTGRPPVNRMVLAGARGSMDVDLFHGFAVAHGGAVSRAAKVLRPFGDAARQAGAAAANLTRRAWRREPAYPGLARLVELFYQAVAHRQPAPIPPADTLATARACDRVAAAVLL
jgi:predicted dehydrogenase